MVNKTQNLYMERLIDAKRFVSKTEDRPQSEYLPAQKRIYKNFDYNSDIILFCNL